ncbi:MAG TPA: hypothetical protein VEG60_01360 [Candidatus Binatia bacterium]|nr:hypothetical protein [Candidatus Binatia bacterium]
MPNTTLIRRSMEILKELTEILREIISSGDEESFRKLQEFIHSLREPTPTIH